MYEIQPSTTNSLTWREFSWKNLTRFFITPKIKSKQTSTPQHCWRLCGEVDANHTHIFWSCNKINDYWEQVGKTLAGILGYKIPITCLVMYLGNITDCIKTEDLFLTKVILAASKKAITKNWLKPDMPTQDDWIRIVTGISLMEKITHNLRLKRSKYDKQWEKWISFVSDTHDIGKNLANNTGTT